LGLNNPTKALATADRCLALNSNGECYYTRGLALVMLGRVDDGLASFQDAKRFLVAEIAMVDIAVRSARTELDRERWALKRDLRRTQLKSVEGMLASAKQARDQPAQKALAAARLRFLRINYCSRTITSWATARR
jgi:hypothetical protein